MSTFQHISADFGGFREIFSGFWPLNFSHVIDSEKNLNGMKELIESVILSLYSLVVSTKAYS